MVPTSSTPIVGNGLFVAFAALTLELPLFLPLAVATIAGDSVAGEANIGTLRYLLTVPAGRTRLLVVKYAAIVIFSFAAAALVALVGSVIGLALFGGGEMILLSGSTASFAEAVGRLLLSVGYLGCGLSALGAIGLFVSTLTEQPIGATVAVVLVNLMMIICDAVEQLSWLHPWLLTHWWTAFGDLLARPDRHRRHRARAGDLRRRTRWCSGCWPGPASPPRTSRADPRVLSPARELLRQLFTPELLTSTDSVA